jgi:putative DNA primase/helicase
MNLRKAKPAEIAMVMIKELPPLAVCDKTEEVYYYEDGQYILFPTEMMNRFVYKFFVDNECSDAWTESKAKGIIAGIRYDPYNVPIVSFDQDEKHINLNNGVLDTEGIKLKQHSPEYYFTYKLDVDYKPGDTKCPEFMSFLESVFNEPNKDGEFEPDWETIDKILKIGGYLLYPKNKMEKLFMFLGDGSNGKSFLIDIYQSFFPKKFVTSLSLKTLSDENSFSREQLIYSKLNISAEEKGQKIDSEQIKRIVSGQDITVNKKFEKNPNITPKTKIVVDSNGLPYFSDSTHGTLRRIYSIKFKNRFVPYEVYKNFLDPKTQRVFPQKQKSAFFSKIMEEKSAILNKFLDGLKSLKDNDWHLAETQNTNEMSKEYQEDTDTIGFWLNENYRIPTEEEKEEDFFGGTPATEIVDNFYQYYVENFPGKKFNYSTKALGRRIKELFRVETEYRFIKNDVSGKRKKITVYPIIEKKENEQE